MRVLILGGTAFIGRHIAEHLTVAGHHVSVFNRGKTPDELPEGVERLRGDRDYGAQGLEALRGRDWDVCVDVSGYTAIQVRASAETLQASINRYVYISAVSVYGDPQDRPVVETHSRIPPAAEDITEITGETYGALKVTCENIVQRVYGGRCTILRPQIVAGPYDPSGRYAYWIMRALHGGEMMAPGDGSDHVQVIDVGDLARFTVKVIKDDFSGVFNMAGPRITWAEFMSAIGAKALTWVPSEVIRSAGITEQELPLYRPERGARSGLMDISSERARAAGLVLTDPASTADEVRAWISERDDVPRLSLESEAELIRTARSTPHAGK